MAFRLVSQRLTGAALRSMSTSAMAPVAGSAAPSIKDVIVTLTFVDPSGARRKVPGLVGKNLHETCLEHGIDIGPSSVGGAVEAVRSDTWTEPLFGEGPSSGYDHVLLVGNGVETAPKKSHVEDKLLNQYWDLDEIFPESRLAAMVTLTKAMDGMTVYVPDRLVDDIP